LTTRLKVIPPISTPLPHHQEQRAGTVPHHTHSVLASPSEVQFSGVKALLITADQARGDGEAEAVVEAATVVAARTVNTASTNIHPLDLLPPTASTLKVKQEKDLHTVQDIMDITGTHTIGHEALNIMVDDEEDGVVAEDIEDHLHLVAQADSI
jgi:hypothetical protein